MDYLLTEEQIMIRDLARQIAVEKIVPVRAELDEQNKFPTDIMKAMAQADLFGIYIPEEYGGLGKKSLDFYIAIEEISKACLGVSTTYAANALGSYPILLHGSEAQKKKYLPDIAAGKKYVTGYGDYTTTKHRPFAGFAFAFGGASLKYELQYVYKDQEREFDENQHWRVWRSKAALEVAW